MRVQRSLVFKEQIWESVFSVLTGTALLRVTNDVGNNPVVFQSDLVQIFIKRSQQRVHVSLVSLQHQFCHTSEGLEGGGSEEMAKK